MAQNPPADVRSREAGEHAEAIHHTPMRLWVIVLLIIFGFTLGAVAIPLHSYPLLIAGVAIFVISSFVGWLMGLMENVH